MTIRVAVASLDRAGKQALVAARLKRDRGQASSSPTVLSLEDVESLRHARPLVDVPDQIVELVLDIYRQLLDQDAASFQWLWDDDRRFGRIFDVLQAEALLHGRTVVTKQDLIVLEFLLWDTPEQIGAVKAVLAPFVRTPAREAREMLDALLAHGGVVATFLDQGGREVDALRQVRECATEVDALMSSAGSEEAEVRAVLDEVKALQRRVANRAAGIE